MMNPVRDQIVHERSAQRSGIAKITDLHRRGTMGKNLGPAHSWCTPSGRSRHRCGLGAQLRRYPVLPGRGHRGRHPPRSSRVRPHGVLRGRSECNRHRPRTASDHAAPAPGSIDTSPHDRENPRRNTRSASGPALVAAAAIAAGASGKPVSLFSENFGSRPVTRRVIFQRQHRKWLDGGFGHAKRLKLFRRLRWILSSSRTSSPAGIISGPAHRRIRA